MREYRHYGLFQRLRLEAVTSVRSGQLANEQRFPL